MGTGIYGIGVSGMNAAQAGLVTTGHNIANASTPGYSRQVVVQTENTPQFTGYGFLGQGVSVSTVKRIYSDVLNNQLSAAQAQGSQLDAYNTQITQLENMLGNSSSGLTPALQDFFSGVAGVASDPQSIPSRQTLLSSANTLASQFQSMDQQMNAMRTGINSSISDSVDSINTYAQQIANLNHSITVAESSGQQPANDLRDQRDELVAELNQVVSASVAKESDGSYDVFVGNGQPIVVGTQVDKLIATPSPEDPQRTEVGYTSGNSVSVIPDRNLQGGTLGGLLSFRSDTLDAAQNALGRVAIGVAQTFNAQQALGQDLNGNLGGEFFSVPSPTVLASSDNAGSATVTASLQSADALTTSDYQLEYNGASGGNESYTLTRVSDGQTTSISFPTAGGYPYTTQVDGMTLTLSAGAVKNDNWSIEPTRNGAAGISVLMNDPAQIAAACPIRTGADAANTGSATISAGSVSSTADLPLATPVTLTYNAATSQFSVSGASPAVANIAYTSGSTISFNGISFTISGSPADGDVFTVEPNTNGTGDNRNALALAALQTTNTLGRDAAVAGSQPTANFEDAYSQLVSQVGNTARQISVNSTAQANVIAQTQQAQQSLSGVNLDEEAANLLRYQQAYQASGKMMQIASTLFQSLLNIAT